MSKKQISTDNAPSAVAVYSQGIMAQGKFVFVSGQVGIDPATGNLVNGVAEQTRQALTNLKNIVEAGGSSLENVVKVTVLLHDINDYAFMNEVYAEFFDGDVPPARAAFGGNDLPLGAQVEIECIAVVPE